MFTKIPAALKKQAEWVLCEVIKKDVDISSPELLKISDARSTKHNGDEKVVRLVRAMKRLSNLVTEPKDVALLINNNFMSIWQVAVQTKGTFTRVMKNSGMAEDRA